MFIHSVYPQIILNENGNSYLSTSSNFITHADLQKQLSELLKSKPEHNNYFVFEIVGNRAILKAAQPSAKIAMQYCGYEQLDNRLIAHFDESFLPYFPSELI